MKKRTRARELALQFLYQLDLRGGNLIEEAEETVHAAESDVETRKFALELIHGTNNHRGSIDEGIQAVAQNWNIARMAVIDRNVLRLAAFELLHSTEVPPKVAINEAIELGKRYSTQNSGAFINGILDKIMNRTKVETGDSSSEAVTPTEAVQGAEESDASETSTPAAPSKWGTSGTPSVSDKSDS